MRWLAKDCPGNRGGRNTSRQKDARSLQRRMDGAEMGVGKHIFVRENSLSKIAEMERPEAT